MSDWLTIALLALLIAIYLGRTKSGHG